MEEAQKDDRSERSQERSKPELPAHLVFPRTDWETAPLDNQQYPEDRTSEFEIAVAAKKASIAWTKARETGDWRGAEDPRWFILAVADRAQERKANLANSRIGKGGRPRSVEEFRRVMRTESFCAFAEALMTFEYPFDCIPDLSYVRDIVGDMLDQNYWMLADGVFEWPYAERPHVPLSALGGFAPRSGDRDVLFHLYQREGGKDLVQVYEFLRGQPRRAVTPWIPVETDPSLMDRQLDELYAGVVPACPATTPACLSIPSESFPANDKPNPTDHSSSPSDKPANAPERTAGCLAGCIGWLLAIFRADTVTPCVSTSSNHLSHVLEK